MSYAVQQLKLLPRVNTSHFLCPTVDVSPYFNDPKANKQNKLGLERNKLPSTTQELRISHELSCMSQELCMNKRLYGPHT